jgi:hypothetical protein
VAREDYAYRVEAVQLMINRTAPSDACSDPSPSLRAAVMPLVERLHLHLTQQLAVPLPAPDSWKFPDHISCMMKCSHCRQFEEFLHSPTHELRMAEMFRKHVEKALVNPLINYETISHWNHSSYVTYHQNRISSHSL